MPRYKSNRSFSILACYVLVTPAKEQHPNLDD
jgi:hypothetical protein